MTKYEMAIAIAQAFNLPSNHLIPVNIDTKICQEISGDVVGGSILYTRVSLSAANRTAGRINSSAHEQSVELFSSGAAEPQCGATTVYLCNC